MSFVYKNNITINIFGASHSEVMGVSLGNIKAGYLIDLEFITKEVKRRQPQKNIGTTRIEQDDFKIVSGVFNGYTTGDNISIIVENKNIQSKHYQNDLMRPGHADFSSYVQSNGYHDYRGGGKFSGRLTILFVIIGAICKKILNQDYGIEIFSQVKNIGPIFDDLINDPNECNYKALQQESFPLINPKVKKNMKELINNCRLNCDSVGGSINCFVLNLPSGVGSPYFDSFESVFSHLMYSIGAVKAVSFGKGSDFSQAFGSECLDELYYDNFGRVCFKNNNNGGINGGISNGNFINSNVVFKPTPSITRNLPTINIKQKKNEILNLIGRHDPCIVSRCGVIVESIMALCIMDLITC